jgi:hypothetical protein
VDSGAADAAESCEAVVLGGMHAFFDARTASGSPVPGDTILTVVVSALTPGAVDSEPNDSPATATPFGEGGARAYGTIKPESDVDYYSVTVSGPEVITATTRPWTSGPSGVDVIDSVLYLYDTDGTTLLTANDDSGSGYSRLSFYLPGAGVYYLAVTSFGGYRAGDYLLEVTTSTAEDLGTVTATAPISAPGEGLAVGESVRYFQLDTDAVGEVTIILTPSAGLDLSLVMLDEYLNRLFTTEMAGAGMAETYALVLPPARHQLFGVYTADGQPATVAGTFDLAVSLQTFKDIGTVTTDAGISGPDEVMAAGTVAAVFRFDGDQQGFATVTVTPAPGLDIYIRPFDPATLIVHREINAGGDGAAESYEVVVDSGKHALFEVRTVNNGPVPSDTTLSIVVSSLGPVTVESEPNNTFNTATPLAEGTTHAYGAIDPGSELDYYAIPVSGPGTIIVSATGGSYPEFLLYDTDGTTALYGWSYDIEYDLPAAGVYYLAVMVWGGWTSDYLFEVTLP